MGQYHQHLKEVNYSLFGHELVVDNFAGAGGASIGMEDALQRGIDLAINHNPLALAVHKENHPSSLSDLRLMDELRRGFFTPPVLVLVLVLLCGS